MKGATLSLGHISNSPLKGLTVTVLPSKIGRLLLNTPSMYLTPATDTGNQPLNPGMKADANRA